MTSVGPGLSFTPEVPTCRPLAITLSVQSFYGTPLSHPSRKMINMTINRSCRFKFSHLRGIRCGHSTRAVRRPHGSQRRVLLCSSTWCSYRRNASTLGSWLQLLSSTHRTVMPHLSISRDALFRDGEEGWERRFTASWRRHARPHRG